ncbi:uncharacterized protein EDB91DRAFT_1256619 [Suillus paluster]|uniref:uncharacterized protein n=1 Tax=Suillus paluster TaxID=48578 RepID=UPI001B87A94E|nr:uncharacterized protein EDB91DRAFT_1256619 [Suillus paluster]KAG1721198.1 hypothetical protein EDB91DRAFT_1256619 [Suillus paluster]
MLCLICSKLDLKPEDYLVDVNQTKFSNDRIKTNGVTPEKFASFAWATGIFRLLTKIVRLEMVEMYDRLDDNGISPNCLQTSIAPPVGCLVSFTSSHPAQHAPPFFIELRGHDPPFSAYGPFSK